MALTVFSSMEGLPDSTNSSQSCVLCNTIDALRICAPYWEGLVFTIVLAYASHSGPGACSAMLGVLFDMLGHRRLRGRNFKDS